jgi:hypothetical protein
MVGACFEVFATAIADVAFVFLITVSPVIRSQSAWLTHRLLGVRHARRRRSCRRDSRAASSASRVCVSFIMGTTMLAIGAMPLLGSSSLVFVGSAFLLGGAANSMHNVAVRTMLQRESPAEAHGKVAAPHAAPYSAHDCRISWAGCSFREQPSAYIVGGILGSVAGTLGWWLFRLFSPRPRSSD